MKRENVVIGNWLLGAIVFVMMMFLGTTADAATIHVGGFQELMILGDPPVVQTLNMDKYHSLKIRDNLGNEITVTAAGYGDGYWNLGLLNTSGNVIGWAKNSSPVPGREDWLIGEYSSLLGNNNRPADAVLVYDKLDNGFNIIDGQVGSPQDLLEGDLFFWTNELYFDGVLGNMNAFAPYGVVAPYARIPEITIPEPATLLILAIGGLFLGKKRSSK